MPNQGTNMWYDSMVITRDCSETDLAHKFINFMTDEESAAANTLEVGYSSPVASVFEEMAEGEYEGISAYVPDVTNPKNETFAYQEPALKQLFADLWTKVKAQ